MPRFKFKYRTWVTIVAIIGLIGGAGFGALRTWEAELFGGEEPAAQTQAAGARAAAGGGQFAAGGQAGQRGTGGQTAQQGAGGQAGQGAGAATTGGAAAGARQGGGTLALAVRAVRPVVAAPLGRSSP